jgi:UDP-N-acetylmuramate dehydrogenase
MDDLREIISAARGLPLRVLGLGSNVLIRDGLLPGFTLRLAGEFEKLSAKGTDMTAGAAVPSAVAAAAARVSNIGGFEFLTGIPGTLGGAVPSNAGCMGGEISKILTGVETLDSETGAVKKLAAGELDFSYRRCALPKNAVITKLSLRGEAGRPDEILAREREIRAKKDAAQPSSERTAGSVFKNPKDKKAWELIRDAGLQGASVGGARISEKHANFIIAGDGASAADIEGLAGLAREKIRALFGITLEYEMEILGSKA